MYNERQGLTKIMSASRGSLSNCNKHHQEHYLAFLTHWEAWRWFHTGRQNQQKTPSSFQNSEPHSHKPKRFLLRELNRTFLLTATAVFDALQEKLKFTLNVQKELFIFCWERRKSKQLNKNQQPSDPSPNSKLSEPPLDYSYQQSQVNGTLPNVRGLHSYSRQHWTPGRFHRPLEKELSTVNTSEVEQNQWLHQSSFYLFFPRNY